MVGRVAMAAAAVAAAPASATDGDVQPAKKRKEDDPSIKAITNYFSPLVKNVDRMLSPPKSNNIMDYFKKSPPANEKVTSPVTEKESTSKSSLSRLNRRGKRCNLNNKLKDMKTVEPDLVIEVDSDDHTERLNPKEEDSKTSSIGHNVPALLAPLNMEDENDSSKNPLDTITFKNEGEMRIERNIIKTNLKRSKKRKHKDETDLSEKVTSETQLKERCKELDDKQVASTNEPQNKSIVNSLDSEINANKTPPLNDCTVTVSFEDFLKSQGENEADQIPKAQAPESSITSDEAASCLAAQQLPLKVVTVLAQIHSIPPKSPACRKIASIFLKQKPKEAKRRSSESSSEVEYAEQMTQKRKSNVVIPEEELELAVLDTTGSETVKSKCTAEERHQFMKAFRQPESDTVKTGAKKGIGKQKGVGEKSLKHPEEIEECEGVSNVLREKEVPKDYVGSDSSCDADKSDITRVRNNRLSRKKMILETKGKGLTSNENQKSDADNQIKGIASCETQSKLSRNKNVLRRSPRQKKSQTSLNITPEKTKISEVVAQNSPAAIPLQTSTPKTNNKSLNKSDLYKVEVITEPFESKSPIRMKFTRISTSEGSTKDGIKVNSTSSNVSKAKKLVEKAKALQHNKATKMTEGTLHTLLRRSSRQQALAERKCLQNAEDSVIILDSCPSNVTTVSESVEKQKNLPSLNDVLGKRPGNVKAAKKPSGKEKPSSLIKKRVQKPADEAVTIVVESSEDESENSQDEEQFKAKREFLMSGLPESLKRQIAKKAASLEAYSAANSCFQSVVHVQQKDERFSMWTLMPPSCPLLTNLREVNSKVTDVSRLTFSLGEFSVLNTQPNSTDSAVLVPSGWRPLFSETLKSCLLEEIRSFNSRFPVKQCFEVLLKKQITPENNKQVNKCEILSPESNAKSDSGKETKRKRKTEAHKSKRMKKIEKSEVKSDKASKVPWVKQAGVENMNKVVDINKTEEPQIIEDSEFESEINYVSDFSNEDMLWTEKYQPQNSSELIGNTAAIKKLHRWLSEWRKRAVWEENRTQKEEENESLDSMDFKDDKSDSEEETLLCNTMLLIGPPGIGKTAAVYACAQELGFKIFEVNASCQRSGRQILSQLKEATQSHQVDKQGVNAHKPCFFNSCSSTKSPRKHSPRKEWSPKKLPVSPRKAGLKQGLAPKTLASYFKISSKPKKKEEKVQGNIKENNKDKLSEENIQKKSARSGSGEEESSKKCATSLILFEEVDIIFDEDVGFLNAIKTFMTTTKRPVILTTNDPSFSLIFDGCFEEITFNVPPLINIASYLQVLCLAENLRTDIRDFAALLAANNCDIRQSILHLQFWVRSGGGFLKEKTMVLHSEENKIDGTKQITCTEEPRSSKTSKASPPLVNSLPKCDSGCFENLLGLKNILLPSEDLFSFLKHEITTEEEWSKLTHLLTEFQMRNIDFIYNNLEFILPLPVNILAEPTQIAKPTLDMIRENSSNGNPLDSDCLQEISPVKKTKQTKCLRNLRLLDDSDLFESELNYSGFITMLSDTPPSHLEEEKHGLKAVTNSTVTPSGGTPGRRKGCALAFQCLNSLTEFVENMSFLDCCFSRTTLRSKSCKYGECIWTKGKTKNGVSDEFSMEHHDWWSSQSSSELKATIEALSFNKCSKTMGSCLNSGRTLGKDELEELTLHVSRDCTNLYFGQLTANSSIHHKAQKRLETIKTVFSNQTSLHLGSRQASIVEYLPTLRNICKLEKQKEQGKTKRRFLHYLEGIYFSRQFLNSLAADFP
ncbi:ATPase family AAA domain-containing protein 5 isoform X2 [Hemicordylus capensis]|uniref:ATPase family AAA domain-containing protein 5 isoform X2 n=1 Tax=Hemicordylus capensis TaxID=884348 RepID=UPI0023023094|nr:ATPase family AAA domain-containing protein 5 isoform X2 [Hemicordylus capensis]